MQTNSPCRLAVPESRALGLAIALAFCGAPAAAQDASVFISSFAYTTTMSPTTGESIELIWSDPFESLKANALQGGGLFGSKSQSLEPPAGYLPGIGFASTANALATYSTPGDQTFFLTAATTKSVGPIGTPRNQAAATGSNSGTFSLAEAGTVTFIIDYKLAVNKPGGNAVNDFATTFLHFNAMSDDGTSGGDRTDQLFSFNQLSGIGAKDGRFAITVSLLADHVGFYTLDGSAESFAVANVPEPQEWALMLAGFLGLGAYVRKRKAAAA